MESKFGLVGKKLLHSFSKKFFDEKFKVLNLSGFSYELWEVEHLEYIKEFIAAQKNVKGFNVTIPFKEEIIRYLDETSEDVKVIGACNCVVIDNDKWIGCNTDWWGFLKMIEGKIAPHHNAAMILGTGGAAKAVAYALDKLNVNYMYISRGSNKVMNKPILKYEELTRQHFEEYSIIINTTPVGMYPVVNSAPNIPIDFINEKNFVIDIIYNPEKTPLLEEAEKRGAKILNGLEMLYLQAEKSWCIWQGLDNK